MFHVGARELSPAHTPVTDEKVIGGEYLALDWRIVGSQNIASACAIINSSAAEDPAVKVVPWVVTYNGMATGPCVYRCVAHLLGKRPRSFGAAIKQIELYPHCQTRERTLPTLEGIRKRFQTRLSTLPFVRFYRTRRLLEVAYASEFVHREELFEAATIELDPAEFDTLCREFAAALLLVRRRLKRSDDFDAAGLEAHLQRRLDLLS